MKQYYSIGLLLSIGFWLCAGQTLLAQAASDSTPLRQKKAPRQLFANDSVMEFSLTVNLRALLRDRGTAPVPHAALLSYTNNQQASVQLPLTVKVRGNFRRSLVNCSFPPLLIDLPKKKTKNTVFAHQNKLKLVTHCQVDEWVVRESLVYKMYNLLTDLSFRAHLARVTYVDSLNKRKPETHWAFLLEDEDDVARRNGAQASNVRQTSMGYADTLNMATVAVFEYMIGNTDWSVPYLHNIRLFDNGQRGLSPVPYDFDHAGIVGALYAQPAAQLGIESVRDRIYRGLMYPMPVFQQVFARFNEVKPQLYALYQNDPRLSKSYVKGTLQYLDEFYALINKPNLALQVFSKGAQAGVVIKGLN